MKRKWSDNLSLKIISVAIGILVWVMVVNIDNPIMTKTFTISNVELLNEAYIDQNGLMCMRDEEQDAVRVTIKGSRKLVSKITSLDIRATADLQQAMSLTDPMMVPISVTCDKISSDSIVEISPRNISLHIEDKLTQEFVVSVTKGETKPAKGYEVGSLESSPEKIKITGPTSLINKIDKVRAAIDVSGQSEDVKKETEVVIIDKNGDTLSETEMSYLNVSKVYVTANLWKVRSDVQIRAEYSGTPAPGYQVESVVTTPDVVSVAGSDEALAALEEQNNIIWIPSYKVNIADKKEDFEEKINITELLYEDLKLTSDSSEEVFVKVNILPEGSNVLEIPTKDIAVKELAEELQVTFETAAIEIRAKATEEGLEPLEQEDIKADINLKEMEVGTYEIPVNIELPEGYELVEGITTAIEISQITSAESSE